MARAVRVSMELYGRMGGCGMDRCEVTRRVLRQVRDRHAGRIPEVVCGCTNGGMPLRLVDLQGLDAGMTGEEIRRALEWLVPRREVVVETEPGWVLGRDGVATKVETTKCTKSTKGAGHGTDDED